MPEALTIRDFLPHLHTQFQIEQFESYNLELTAVTEYSNAQLEHLFLIFTGDSLYRSNRVCIRSFIRRW